MTVSQKVTARSAHPETVPPPSPADRPPAGLTQPYTGLLGLVIVLAVAAVLGFCLGPQDSLEAIGSFSTFCLPVLAVAALWWGCSPDAQQSAPMAGLTVTGIIVGAGLILTAVGQAVIGKLALGHLLGQGNETKLGELTTFPWTVPLAAFVFVTMLQLTFVCRKWPFASLSPVLGGLAALATSWAVGLIGYFALANWDFVPAPVLGALGVHNPGGRINALDLVAILLCVVIWQMSIFFLLEGYPFSKISSNAAYLVAANATTIGGGILTWMVLHDGLDRTVPQVSAIAGSAVVGTLVTGLLLEGWPARLVESPAVRRLALLATAGVITAITAVGLRALSEATQTWTRDPAQLWVAVSALNFIGAVVILHVAVWRRWPLRTRG